MGLSNLGLKKIRRIERRTNLPVKWASVLCHGMYWVWRFWTPVAENRVRLGHWDTRSDTWELTDGYLTWNEDRQGYYPEY